MKTIHRLLLAAVLILSTLSSGAQNKKARYSEFMRGYDYFHTQQFDSAFAIFSRYVETPVNDLQTAWAYTYLGQIQWKTSDLYSAQQSLLNADNILDSVNEKSRSEIAGYVYNLLGNVSLDLKRYDDAIEFYNKAIPFFKGTDYSIEIVNGKAIAFQRKKDYDHAIALYDSILAFKPTDNLLLARMIDNRARTKWLQNPDYPALNEFHTAIKIRLDSNYTTELIASYAHLSDYYANRNLDSALWYAHKMRESAIESESSDDILEAFDKLVLLNNSTDTIKQWHIAFKKLNDSLQFARDTTHDRFALIKHDSRKNKADNLILQKDNTQQRTWLVILITFSIIAIIAIIVLSIRYALRRKRLKRESEIAIRDSRLKTSQKVHDVVANELYRIMNELEHGEEIEKEPLITKIEMLYEKSRNISYEDIMTVNNTDYHTHVQQLLTAFATEQTKVVTAGNGPAFWSKVTSSQKRELELMLKELMVNMSKHSKAKNVSIVFKQEDNKGFITYKDDGVGFESGHEFGNGLRNTVSRIKSLNGNINFGKSEKGGVSIELSFPL